MRAGHAVPISNVITVSISITNIYVPTTEHLVFEETVPIILCGQLCDRGEPYGGGKGT